MNELVFMIDLDKSAPYFLAKAVVVGLGLFTVVCSTLIFLVFYKMRRNASHYSAQTIQMHKRLTQLLIVQVEFCKSLWSKVQKYRAICCNASRSKCINMSLLKRGNLNRIFGCSDITYTYNIYTLFQ